MENKNILITGAAGFIGSHLVETISKMKPARIIGVDNFISGTRANIELLQKIPNFEFIEKDICDLKDVEGEVDYIFNFACPASPTDFEKLRIDIVRTGSVGDFNMLELARIKNATYVYASSSEVYGDALENPQKETYNGNVNINGVRSVYDENKRFGETMAMAFHREYNLKTRIVRIFNTYGERMRRDDGRSTPTFIDQAIKNEDITVFGDGSQTRSPQYVSDLVDGVIKLAQSDITLPVNIGNPQELTMNDLAKKIIEITGSTSKIIYKPLPEHDPKVRRPDITRARELLNWEPKVPLEEGLKKIEEINWKENEIFVPVFENNIEKNILFEKIEQDDKKEILERAKRFGFIGEKEQYFSYKNYHFLAFGKLEKITNTSYFETVANFLKKAIKEKHLDIYFLTDEKYLTQIAQAFYFAKYSFDKYKSEKKEKKDLQLHLIIANANKEFQEELDKIECVASGVDLSRNLINEPSSNIHPQTLLEEAKKIVDASHGYLELEVLDKKKCLELKMEAFLAVAQGSHQDAFFIIIKTKDYNQLKPIVLIGKSVTFDSGGLNIKTGDHMEDMKIDMAGGAIVLGVFDALAKLKNHNFEIQKNIIGIIPACENMPASQAIRPGDIVTALNGKTIEILNTDAEGRLTLADALSYSEKYLNPEIVLDIATLTGSIMAALGPDVAGLFSNNKQLVTSIIQSGEEEGEAIWEMPLYEKYAKHIKSDIADLRNISKIRLGGSITASLFLKSFISDKIKWAHMDVAGVVHDKQATGWGVRTVINFLNKPI